MILDVGSGGKGYAETVARGDVCIDILKTNNNALNFIQASGYYLPFQNEIFDKVFFYDVIEHLDSPILCLIEIKRVLKPGGMIEISTPNPLHWRIFLRALRGKDIVLAESEPDHIAVWTEAELRNILSRSGFSHVQIRFRILEATRKGDARHMRFDMPLFKLGFHRVTGRNMIAEARKD